MNGFRSLTVSFVLLFVLMFSFGTSLQAAEVLEQRDLAGPSAFQGAPPGTACVGDVVGRVTIEKKGEDLAQQIVGAVTGINKSNESVTVTVRFRNGPPNRTNIPVRWRPLDVPGDCGSVTPGTWGQTIARINTDADGAARVRAVLPANPFPGKGVKIYVCFNIGAVCQPGDPAYWALFNEVF